MTNIKFNAGDEVFWLSNKGFVKGWIKRVQFSEEKMTSGGILKDLKYFLTNKSQAEIYQGDEVNERLIFTSQKEMFDFYQKQKL